MIPTKEDRDFASLTILSGGLHRSPFPFLPSSLSVLVFSRPPHIALGKGRQIQTSKAVAVCVCVCPRPWKQNRSRLFRRSHRRRRRTSGNFPLQCGRGLRLSARPPSAPTTG